VSGSDVNLGNRVGVAFGAVLVPMPASDATTAVATVPSTRNINAWICIALWAVVLYEKSDVGVKINEVLC
jgi:hypothetical protein